MSEASHSSDFELRRRLLQMELLYEIGVALSESLDPRLVAEEILQRALAMVDARGAVLLVRDTTQEGFSLAGQAGSEGAADALLDLPEIGLAWQENRPMRKERQADTWQYLCIVPLTCKEHVEGVLVVADREARQGTVGPFDQEDENLLRSFAYQAGTALHNAWLHRALQQAYQELQQAHKKIAQLEQLRALGDLSAEAAHTMGHYLGLIMGRADVYLNFPTAPEKAMRTILETAEKGQEVIERLRRTARLGVGKKRVQTDLNSLIDETVEEVKSLWQQQKKDTQAKVEWETRLGNIPRIWLNPADVKEALTNLLLNALEAMPQGGRLTLQTGKEGEGVLVRVVDTGKGMDQEVQRRIFEPFFTTKEQSGSGLGLSIVYRIVEDHRGRIEVESQPGRGSTFAMRLPMGQAPAEAQEQANGQAGLDR